MLYEVISKSKSFRVLEAESRNEICKIIYESYWNSNAEYSYNGNHYQIKSSNVWQSKFDILRNTQDIGDIDYNWKGEIIIRLRNKESMTKHFIMKCTNIFTSVFNVKDFLTNNLWTIKPQWNWKSLNYKFFVSREEGFHEEENNVDELELMVASIFAALLYIKMASSAA